LIATELALPGTEREPLERAAKALLADQHNDGGWGYHAGVPTDADSTACALLFLAAMGHEGSRVRRARACLARHQDANSGGVSTYRAPGPIRRFMGLGTEIDLDGWCSSHAEVTAMAGRAFAASTSTPPGWEAEAAWGYVSSRQRANGSWLSYWWTAPHYPTLQAVALAAEMGDETALKRAADWALREQNCDGGWSAPGAPTSAFATALSLSVLLRAGMNGSPVDRAMERLVALQDADGGWPSHPTMRIPPPGLAEPDNHDSWRIDGLGTGVVVGDQHRMFTTSVCVGALALARARTA
jgi:Squalene-hopene cyclase C-terminal domain/Prenyltransferase and squalene oxidase repeat